MKDAKFLIDHIYNNPLFKKLKAAKECQELLSLIAPAQRNLIAFCYVRGSVIYFALRHPVGLAELKRDSSINMLKGLLKAFVKTREETIFKDVGEIKFFITNLAVYKPTAKPKPLIFKPFSEAKFQNLSSIPEFYAAFEEIRKILADKNAKFKACSC